MWVGCSLRDCRGATGEVLASRVASRLEVPVAEARKAIAAVMPAIGLTAAWKKLRQRTTLIALGADDAFIDAWLAVDGDGPLLDEVRFRAEGLDTRYAHVIVDEAQDLTLFQLRAVMRRAEGLTLVGDDAQQSVAGGVGLRQTAALFDVALEQMDTAYRMSAEIAEWLNAHAVANGIDAVQLVGIRPTGVPVSNATDVATAVAALSAKGHDVAVIEAGEVWIHKGVEYDAVVVVTDQMTPSEIYLAASRAAHELVIV